MTHNKTKTGNKIPKGTHQDKTNIRKVPGFSLCTAPYDAYIGGPNVAGTGAFSYPVYPGDCDDVRNWLTVHRTKLPYAFSSWF